MSTDRNDIALSGVVEGLGVRRFALQRVDWQHELTMCLKGHADIWDHPDDENFTRHGVEHSAQILHPFERLEERYGWSDYEKLVFIQAAFIHDVGMQYNRWSQYPVNDERTPLWKSLGLQEPRLSPKDIRQQHVRLGAALVQAEYKGERNWVRPLSFCSGTSAAREILAAAWRVAFAHSDNEFLWEKYLRRDIFLQRKELPGGMPMRPRLLAGTLRLCDELDGNFTRVPDADRLWRSDLPSESRVHWLSCHYVMGAELHAVGESAYEVRIRWRVPEGAPQDVVQLIKVMLERTRLAKIRKTVEDVNEMFERGGEGGYLLACESKIDEQPCDDTLQQRISPDLITLLRELPGFGPVAALRVAAPLDAVRGDSTDEVGLGDEGDGLADFEPPADVSVANPEGAPADPPPATPAPAESIEEALATWFRSNLDPDHWELANGLHTDTFLHCRSLVSDHALRTRLVDHIVTRVANEHVRVVIGIGTSCIPLAVSLGLRLQARATFGFAPSDVKPGGNADAHLPFEIEPIIEADAPGRILMVDDVLVRGESAAAVRHKVIQVAQDRGFTEADIIHVALFRLGEFPVGEGPHKTLVLCHMPDVYYAASRETCKFCLGGSPELRREVDL